MRLDANTSKIIQEENRKKKQEHDEHRERKRLSDSSYLLNFTHEQGSIVHPTMRKKKQIMKKKMFYGELPCCADSPCR
jgi:hypothetical protein